MSVSMVTAVDESYDRLKKILKPKNVIIKMNSLTVLMNQTRKELVTIARAENVPYSRVDKATLAGRIRDYRDTVGTLYRESKKDLMAIAKSERATRVLEPKKAGLNR